MPHLPPSFADCPQNWLYQENATRVDASFLLAGWVPSATWEAAFQTDLPKDMSELLCNT